MRKLVGYSGFGIGDGNDSTLLAKIAGAYKRLTSYGFIGPPLTGLEYITFNMMEPVQDEKWGGIHRKSMQESNRTVETVVQLARLADHSISSISTNAADVKHLQASQVSGVQTAATALMKVLWLTEGEDPDYARLEDAEKKSLNDILQATEELYTGNPLALLKVQKKELTSLQHITTPGSLLELAERVKRYYRLGYENTETKRSLDSMDTSYFKACEGKLDFDTMLCIIEDLGGEPVVARQDVMSNKSRSNKKNKSLSEEREAKCRGLLQEQAFQLLGQCVALGAKKREKKRARLPTGAPGPSYSASAAGPSSSTAQAGKKKRTT